MKIIVAIDGFSSCGKSTMAKGLAAYAGYTYVDTGAMYRAVALYCIRKGWITEDHVDETQLQAHIHELDICFRRRPDGGQDTILNGENVEKLIRTLDVGNAASRVSTIGFVRRELVKRQQAMGEKKGIVMDGRDIGTVVFPNAELKIFVTARPEVRAQRRYQELLAKGEQTTFEKVLDNVRERDFRDTHRTESPLKQAEDAILFDNSELTRTEQMEKLERIFDKAVHNFSL